MTSVPWRRFLIAFGATLAVAMAVIYAFLVLIDPYDSGRFASLGLAGIADDNPRTANVSRGRDPRFDSAIIGNSTGAMLDPARLSRATGLNFVQLTVSGALVREQLAVLLEGFLQLFRVHDLGFRLQASGYGLQLNPPRSCPRAPAP